MAEDSRPPRRRAPDPSPASARLPQARRMSLLRETLGTNAVPPEPPEPQDEPPQQAEQEAKPPGPSPLPQRVPGANGMRTAPRQQPRPRLRLPDRPAAADIGTPVPAQAPAGAESPAPAQTPARAKSPAGAAPPPALAEAPAPPPAQAFAPAPTMAPPAPPASAAPAPAPAPTAPAAPPARDPAPARGPARVWAAAVSSPNPLRQARASRAEAPPAGQRPAPQRGQRQRHGRRLLPKRRSRRAGLLASILLIAVAGALALDWPVHAGGSGPSPAGSSSGLSAAQAARRHAVAWVAQQVTRSAVVACDRLMCSSLAAQGFPVGNLIVLGPTATDPLGANVVIATADIRSEIGSRLAGRYAPQVLASFDSGSGRIDVRAIFPDGIAAYRAAFSADLQVRKASGAALLRNNRIITSAIARMQLATGQVDARLLITIATMAAQHPVQLVGFSGLAPGASAGSPFRFAEVAEPDGAGTAGSLAYVRSVRALLGVQHSPFLPLRTQTTRLAGGQGILRIEFAAPGPLGLIAATIP